MTPKERCYKVMELREKGLTYKAIGKEMGFGVERARQLYLKGRRYKNAEKAIGNCHVDIATELKNREEYKFRWMLSARAYNALERQGIRTLKQLKETEPEKIIKFRNIGKKTYSELMKIREMEV